VPNKLSQPCCLFNLSLISAGVFLGEPKPKNGARLVARDKLSHGRGIRHCPERVAVVIARARNLR
jgi:hypothetical protein